MGRGHPTLVREGSLGGAVLNHPAPMNHLQRFCTRNLKNEMPLNKFLKTAIENSFSSIGSAFPPESASALLHSLYQRESKVPPPFMALIVVYE
jgi:hypothetical protein